jgi:hypothetical protein
MPLKLWDEAYLTAIFLINRTPSRVISVSNTVRAPLGSKA